MEQALILEEKMGLQLKLLASAGVETLPIETPSYCHLVTEHQDSEKIRKEVMNAIQVNIIFNFIIQYEFIFIFYFFVKIFRKSMNLLAHCMLLVQICHVVLVQ